MSTVLSSGDGINALGIKPLEIIMNTDQVKGRAKEVEGAVKEVAGKTVGNTRLEDKGRVEKSVGKVQAGIGDLKEDLKK
ncbi:CsbD family protein [Pseudomonas akapageensis]|uniref:CsbD family protein n=1 Tax=Pseudomonas akapageensis TaxID=2609961 RepID=UPI001FE4EA5F|nr:CsbD family protein [Pseudomonas akapageensis]